MPTPDAKLTDEQLALLRGLDELATPGPWGWRGQDDGLVELRGHGPFGDFDGRIVSTHRADPCIVTLVDESLALAYDACEPCAKALDEVVLTGSSDLFENHRCAKPENLGTIWLRGEAGIEPANRWAVRERHYRNDVAYVDHADALFIAAARDAVPVLIGEIDRLRAVDQAWQFRWQEQFDRAERTEEEIARLVARYETCECGHTLAQHSPLGCERSGCNCLCMGQRDALSQQGEAS